MERFKSLLQKLQEVYNGSQQKSAVDIDLMLDYTRVIYADLLEWRKEFTDPLRPPFPSGPREPEPQPVEKPVVAIVEKEDPVVAETPEAAPVAKNQAERVEAPPLLPEPELVAEPISPVDVFPEKEEIATLTHEHTGISYEPPFHPEKPVIVEDVLVEEAPAEPAPVAEEMPAPAPVEIPLPEFKPYEPAKLFDAIVERKDIRTAVGINDKYLFLNELFNNHKSDYEETLDMLNRLGSQEEATNWVRDKVAGPRKWDREDPTVQGFYALIAKHFSAR